MRRTALLWLALPVAVAFLSGCGVFKKEVYMVPTQRGWYEMQIKEKGDKIKLKPAEKVEVKHEY